jgi:hypothetical protein
LTVDVDASFHEGPTEMPPVPYSARRVRHIGSPDARVDGQGAHSMGSIHEVMEAFREAPSNSERGTKFEKLMVRYFDLDPLSQQYDAVWRWIDWPGRKGKPDTGIDLVARERDTGEYTASQCKFYELTHQLRKEDIDSFFTASGKQPFANRIIISTTDRWGATPRTRWRIRSSRCSGSGWPRSRTHRSAGTSPGSTVTCESTCQWWPITSD